MPGHIWRKRKVIDVLQYVIIKITITMKKRKEAMGRDILFKTDDIVFSYRVGGIIILRNKILLQRPKNDNYSIIGGHISSMEISEDALKREFEEELHTQIVIDRLMAVGEIFFPWGRRTCHQIALYYKVHLLNENDIPLEGIFHGYDEFNNKRVDLDFCWVPLDELRDGLTVYPVELIPYILGDKNRIGHFISK